MISKKHWCHFRFPPQQVEVSIKTSPKKRCSEWTKKVNSLIFFFRIRIITCVRKSPHFLAFLPCKKNISKSYWKDTLPKFMPTLFKTKPNWQLAYYKQLKTFFFALKSSINSKYQKIIKRYIPLTTHCFQLVVGTNIESFLMKSVKWWYTKIGQLQRYYKIPKCGKKAKNGKALYWKVSKDAIANSWKMSKITFEDCRQSIIKKWKL